MILSKRFRCHLKLDFKHIQRVQRLVLSLVYSPLSSHRCRVFYIGIIQDLLDGFYLIVFPCINIFCDVFVSTSTNSWSGKCNTKIFESFSRRSQLFQLQIISNSCFYIRSYTNSHIFVRYFLSS